MRNALTPRCESKKGGEGADEVILHPFRLIQRECLLDILVDELQTKQRRPNGGLGH